MKKWILPALLIGGGAVALLAGSGRAKAQPAPPSPHPDIHPTPDVGPVPPGEVSPPGDRNGAPEPGTIRVDPVPQPPPTTEEEVLHAVIPDVLQAILEQAALAGIELDWQALRRQFPGLPEPVWEAAEEWWSSNRPEPELERIPGPAPQPTIPLPTLPPVTPVTPITPVIPLPPVDALTNQLLLELLPLERTANWKGTSESVRHWQRARGLTSDGKFGPGSALRLAEETGAIPIVRYWPSGSQQHTAVPAYRDRLGQLAAEAHGEHRAGLLAAIEREQGQGFGTPPRPIAVTIHYLPGAA